MVTKTFIAQRYDISGFSITCECLPDGSFRNLTNNKIILGFPPEVELFGITYTLEEIITVGHTKHNPIQQGEYA